MCFLKFWGRAFFLVTSCSCDKLSNGKIYTKNVSNILAGKFQFMSFNVHAEAGTIISPTGKLL